MKTSSSARTVGIDLGDRKHSVCVLDSKGGILKEGIHHQHPSESRRAEKETTGSGCRHEGWKPVARRAGALTGGKILENVSSINAMTDDPYNLDRFVSAQLDDYEAALEELKRGKKQSHWIWFIFPQVAGLGSSPIAQHYAIKSREEAVAYLRHPVLGPRLLECVEALLQIVDRTANEVMGFPDDVKLRSSMTLFAAVSEPGSQFHAVLDRFYSGQSDPRTVAFLEKDQVG